MQLTEGKFKIPESDFHPPSQEAAVSRPWRNAGVLRSLGEGGLELRRVTPHHRCHGLLPVGLHWIAIMGILLEDPDGIVLENPS